MPTTSGQPPRRKTGGRRRTRRPKAPSLFPAIVAVVLLILAIGGSCLLYSVLSGDGDSEEVVASSSVVKTQSVPENDYDSEGFTAEEDGTITYEDTFYYSLKGIDVSSHQGEIDWTAVAGDDVAFAILRIGYRGYTAGALNPDARFSENYAAARDAGIQVGVYFYSQAITVDEAREEAEYVLSLLDGMALDLPVFYDWEKQSAEGSRTADTDYSVLTDCALAFCKAIRAGGYEAGVYFYSSLALDTYDLSYLTDFMFWLSQPGETPDFDYRFALWQYSYTGTVSGINGSVDMDMMLVSTTD